MVAGLLGNESSDSNRFILVTPKSENDVRLQATLGNQNPTGLPVGVVSPSCVIGSAIAGGLSVAFNCQLRAPHGGVFVIATVSNWPLYLLAIAVGSVVGCLVLSTLKKAK